MDEVGSTNRQSAETKHADAVILSVRLENQTTVRSVLLGLASAIPSPCAFGCFVDFPGTMPIRIERLVDGQAHDVSSEDRLQSTFGISDAIISTHEHEATILCEPWMGPHGSPSPYANTYSRADGFVRALIVVYTRGGILYGALGVERRYEDRPFSADEATLMARLAPLGAFAAEQRRRAAAVAGVEHTDVLSALSKREREVAVLLVAGYTSDNIGARFGVSPNTIRTYIRRLYAKLGIFSRTDLSQVILRVPWPSGEGG